MSESLATLVNDGVFLPLNPKTKNYLDELKVSNAPPKPTLPISEVRKTALERASQFKTKTPVASVADRTILGPGGELPVRIYTPEANGLLPLLVYIHGGGWATNSLDTHDELCRKLSQETGSVVVSVHHRLAPEAKFPAPLEDCTAAIEWASQHAAEWNADAKRLIVAGDSSGGNLAAAVAFQSRQNGSPVIAGQVLLYPVTDYYEPGTESYRSYSEGYALTSADMRWFWDLYLPDKKAANNPLAAPLRAKNLEGLPPALVITAEYDPLVDEGNAYARRLEVAGVPTTHSCYEGTIHGFLVVPDLVDDTDRAVRDVKQWLEQLPAAK